METETLKKKVEEHYEEKTEVKMHRYNMVRNVRKNTNAGKMTLT